jgi:predicted nucleotidyltransferase
MNYGLDDRVIGRIRAAFSRYPEIEKAILYGSRAKGTYKNGSDIDLTLTGDRLNTSILSRLGTELDDLLLPFSFDLSILADIANADLVDHIKRVGTVVYQKTV